MIFLESKLYTITNYNVNFTSANAWSFIMIIGVLFLGILIAHILKRNIGFLKRSLIPTSVLAGIIILIVSTIYESLNGGELFFNTPLFSVTNEENEIVQSGSEILQLITYHCLGIGFVAMGLRQSKKKTQKVSSTDVFNTGVTTVSTYALQGGIGLLITIIFSKFNDKILPGSGSLLSLGYGQGTGQALNFGQQFEEVATKSGTIFYGANFGLTLAALGFLSASVGGVIYLNVIRAQKKITTHLDVEEALSLDDYQEENDIETSGSIDKLTIEVGIIALVYSLSFFLMKLLAKLAPSMASTFFGFNFLLGTLLSVVAKALLNFLKKKNVIKKNYLNNYLLNRVGGTAFDIMIVAGIAVIDLKLLLDYWLVLVVLGICGLVFTLFYIRLVSHKLFKGYMYEELFAMYGMLTGTASTGMILLREIDPNFESPAADNLVYQNLPAIILGLPLIVWIMPSIIYKGQVVEMTIATFAYFIILQIILFRSKIFKSKNKKVESVE